MKKLLGVLCTIAISMLTVFGFAGCGKEKLIVYTEAGFAPFEYLDNGKIVGVDVDIMNKVGEKLGKKVVFEDVSFDTIVDAVSEGKVCNVGAAGISITEERAAKVNFSTEYYTAKLYVIYKVSEAQTYESTTTDNVTGIYWDSLAGKKIAVQGGTTADLFLGDEIAEGGVIYGTNAVVTPYTSLATAVADVKLNMDVLVIDELPAQQLIKNDSSLKCAPLYYQGEEGENGEPAVDEAAVDVYAICVTKGQEELLKAINEVLAELKAEDHDGVDGIQYLVNKHLGL